MSEQADKKKGEFLGMPYDWRPLNDEGRREEQQQRPDNQSLFVPKRFGWGYTINLGNPAARRLFLVFVAILLVMFVVIQLPAFLLSHAYIPLILMVVSLALVLLFVISYYARRRN
jgi:Family of unknown function (DUF5808)